MPINLASLLLKPGAAAQGSPNAPAAGSNMLFSQSLMQQLLGASVAQTGNGSLSGLMAASPASTQIKSLLSKLAAQPGNQGAQSQVSTQTTKDAASIDPLLAGLLNGLGLLPGQIQPLPENPLSATPSTGLTLGLGISGNTSQAAQALHQVLATLMQQVGPNTSGFKIDKSIALGNEDAGHEKNIFAAPPASEPQMPVTGAPVTAIANAATGTQQVPGTHQNALAQPIERSANAAEAKSFDAKTATGTENGPAAADQHAKLQGQMSGQNQSQAGSEKGKDQAEQFFAAADQPQSASSAQSARVETSGSMIVAAQAGGESTAQVQTGSAGNAGDTATQPAITAADSAPPRIVHEARLMEAAGQAEMQVSMRSESAGTLNLKATLEGSHINATVATPSSETRDWLVANVHELHASLSRDDLNLRSFQVSDSGLQNGWNGSDARQQQSQEQYRFSTQSEEKTRTIPETTDLELTENTSQALSLHA